MLLWVLRIAFLMFIMKYSIVLNCNVPYHIFFSFVNGQHCTHCWTIYIFHFALNTLGDLPWQQVSVLKVLFSCRIADFMVSLCGSLLCLKKRVTEMCLDHGFQEKGIHCICNWLHPNVWLCFGSWYIICLITSSEIIKGLEILPSFISWLRTKLTRLSNLSFQQISTLTAQVK